MDEATGESGGNEPGAPDTWNFSIDVAKSWEAAFFEKETPRTRKVALRSAMTFSPGRRGVFPRSSAAASAGRKAPAHSTFPGSTKLILSAPSIC